MILLGSIERAELQAVSDWWLSVERRVFESSLGPGIKVSWESFAYVDEEEGEEIANKVSETHMSIYVKVFFIRLDLTKSSKVQHI